MSNVSFHSLVLCFISLAPVKQYGNLCVVVSTGEMCSVQEKDGRQVIHCTWARRSPGLANLATTELPLADDKVSAKVMDNFDSKSLISLYA